VCELENLKNEETMTRFGLRRQSKKKSLFLSNFAVLAATQDEPKPSGIL
jgi:hypothetical protein